MGDDLEATPDEDRDRGGLAGLRLLPANEVGWAELRTVFGPRGPGSRCLCQRYRLDRGESFERLGPEVLAERLRGQADCGHPESTVTSGLVALLGDEPVGWCAVAPRPDHVGLVRVVKVPWAGRAENPADEGVWAITCVFVRAGYRRRGLSGRLAAAAVTHARDRGARAVEAYPLVAGASAIDEERHVGSVAIFASAGMREVAHPTRRRVVMRIENEPSRIPDN